MRYLGFDVGTKSLGIAISDKSNQIAMPYKTLHFKEMDFALCLPEITRLVSEKQITDFVVGLPKNMDNTSGFATKRSEDFKEFLANNFSMPIHFIDERLSTIEAEKILIQTNHSRQKRKKVIDNVASALILDTYLRKKLKDEQ